MTRGGWAAVLAAAGLLCVPGSALAATVRAVYAQEVPSVPATLTVRFDAARGEANRVAVASRAGDPAGVEVRDAAATLSAGDGCAVVDPHTVHCTPALFTAPVAQRPSTFDRVAVALGDGADEATSAISAGRVAATGPPVHPRVLLRGGDGSDRLTGDEGTDDMDGGPGPDRLAGAGGPDFLSGGAGRDRVSGGDGDDFLTDDDRLPPAGAARAGSADDDRLSAASARAGGVRDVFNGGAGRDRVSWAPRATAVRVDLARRRGADGDLLLAVEDAEGGAGRDVLRGDRGPNRLFGGARADVVEGRAGGDTLTGGDGADRLLGGSGRDLLELLEPRDDPDSPGAPDRAACGSGRDAARYPRGADRVGTDCERAIVSEPDGVWEVAVALPLPVSRTGEVALRLTDTRAGDPFAGRATLKFGALFLARPSRPVRLAAGGRATARVRIVAAALARLRESRRLTVTVGIGSAAFKTLIHPPGTAPRRTGPSGGTTPG